MPLVTEYNAVKEAYEQAAELGVVLPAFNTEDRETLEAILAASLEYGQEIGVDNLPVIPSVTARYPPRAQLTLVTTCGDPRLGMELTLSDLRLFTSDDSPYRSLRVMPHLDHAFPWLDGDMLLDYADQLASIMCDASERPFEENIRLTADYVEQVRGRVVVEGAVDEIFEAGGTAEKDEPTTVEQADRFLRETGVDLIVPNVGTEHRSTAVRAQYRSQRAHEISDAVGKILVLHGTSSVKPEDIPKLAEDGVVKTNIFTTLTVHGGQAVARQVLGTLGNVFTEAQLQDLVDQEILGTAVLAPDYGDTQPPIKPKLDYTTTPRRRDAWFGAVKERCKEFLRAYNHHRFAR